MNGVTSSLSSAMFSSPRGSGIGGGAVEALEGVAPLEEVSEVAAAEVGNLMRLKSWDTNEFMKIL